MHRAAGYRGDLGPPPSVLLVKSPAPAVDCQGVYTLKPGTVNGMPLWENDAGNRWMFSTHAGWWMLTDSELSFSVDGCAGLLCSTTPHKGLWPHLVDLWQYGDGAEWHLDTTIAVTSPQGPRDAPRSAPLRASFAPDARTLMTPPEGPPPGKALSPRRGDCPPGRASPPLSPRPSAVDPCADEVTALRDELRAERVRRCAAEVAADAAMAALRALTGPDTPPQSGSARRELLSPSQAAPLIVPSGMQPPLAARSGVQPSMGTPSCMQPPNGLQSPRRPPVSDDQMPLRLFFTVAAAPDRVPVQQLLPLCGVYVLQGAGRSGDPVWVRAAHAEAVDPAAAGADLWLCTDEEGRWHIAPVGVPGGPPPPRLLRSAAADRRSLPHNHQWEVPSVVHFGMWEPAPVRCAPLI